jgi:phosphoenolpyruvate carboxykinase (ATP)
VAITHPTARPTSGGGIEREILALAGEVVRDLPPAALVEAALANGEGLLAAHGPLITRSGRHTGRSPLDRYVVAEPSSEAAIWWGPVNRPMTEAQFERLEAAIRRHVAGSRLYARTGAVGADPLYRHSVRVITETAWHNLFGHHLFLRPQADERTDAPADFTVIDLPTFRADAADLGVRSETLIALHLGRRLLFVGGTAYAGEMKKGLFTVMNHLLPEQDVLPMHCAANVGPAGDVALFFGLSGTGKTTLSTVPSRTLVGDDEIGWGDRGVFNFEGGCYAKLIRLSPEAEPVIWARTQEFGTVAENVVYDDATREIDLESDAITENTRGGYPVTALTNVEPSGMAGQPSNVLLLAADAFGVLPPVSRLTVDQAVYHFLSGYTAKLAGTEVGVAEPAATFSACFGAPFMPRHPAVYAAMLRKRLVASGATAWLVNTGWTGGPYGVGHRIAISDTRAMVDGILDGTLSRGEFRRDLIFGLDVPVACPDVDPSLLDPRSTWSDPVAYERQAATLAGMFHANFDTLTDQARPEDRKGAPLAGRDQAAEVQISREV